MFLLNGRNELITGSLKYAGLLASSGRLTIAERPAIPTAIIISAGYIGQANISAEGCV